MGRLSHLVEPQIRHAEKSDCERQPFDFMEIAALGTRRRIASFFATPLPDV